MRDMPQHRPPQCPGKHCTARKKAPPKRGFLLGVLKLPLETSLALVLLAALAGLVVALLAALTGLLLLLAGTRVSTLLLTRLLVLVLLVRIVLVGHLILLE
jgi:hypothetical protein